MDTPERPAPQLTPEQRAMMKLAHDDESAAETEATLGWLRNRVRSLNVEARLRAENIAELEAQLQAVTRERDDLLAERADGD